MIHRRSYCSLDRMLEYRLTREEWDAEISDFLYGIFEVDHREMTEEDHQHLKDMQYVKQFAPSVYDLP